MMIDLPPHQNDAPPAASPPPRIAIRPVVVYGFLGLFIFGLGLGVGYLLGEQVTLSVIQSVSNQVASDTANAVVAAMPPANNAGAGVQVAAPAAQQPITRFPIDADDDPFLGSPNAPIVIVEFTDYQCSFCALFYQQTFYQLLQRYPNDIKLVVRDFPINNIHPQASQAAVAANCAGEQDQYWEMHDLLFENQNLIPGGLRPFAEYLNLDLAAYDDCMQDPAQLAEVRADYRAAVDIGVRATPTFFINGRPLVGAQPIDVFIDIIEQELALLTRQ